MRVVTANVNGIRAAARKGGVAVLAATQADVVTLQEVRASPQQLAEVLGGHGFADAAVAHACCGLPGRSGVAVVARTRLHDLVTELPGFAGEGRWVEATVDTPDGPLVVVSVYVPKGHVGDARQDHKMAFFAAMDRRMSELLAGRAVVTGDLNVARTPMDIKAWRSRIGKAGFLPEERAHLDRWETAGWVDLGRALAGPGPGPYTWWSNRGRAFDNDAGWRIDYVWATPAVAAGASSAQVLRAAAWHLRWSDHAGVLVDL